MHHCCARQFSRAAHRVISLLQLLAEIKIHRSLSHPYIVGFDSFFEDRANVYIMLELCPNQVRPRVDQRAISDACVVSKLLGVHNSSVPTCHSDKSIGHESH